MRRAESKNHTTGRIAALLAGMYLLSALLLLIVAVLMYRFRLNRQGAQLAVLFVYAASCFLGGFLIGKTKKVRKFLWGMMMGLAYFAILLVISFAVNGGKIDDIVQVCTSLIICTASSTIGGMVS